MDSPHVLEVWGDFACFSRPDLKVERYSYPLPTPSAARGVFEAIYFKPEFYWQVTRIETLTPPSYIALRRNEVKDKASVPRHQGMDVRQVSARAALGRRRRESWHRSERTDPAANDCPAKPSVSHFGANGPRVRP